jgi:carbonic anhydrase
VTSSLFEIRPASTKSDIVEVRRLLEDYAAWIAIDLSFQNFAEEMNGLPGEYAPPSGALFIGWTDERPAGCVAVRRIDDQDCEMKRLFVREATRGGGGGEQLARRAIAWARGRGYRRMLLDTLPSMSTAHRLYERLGFTQIPAYRFNPVPGAQFMALVLNEGPDHDARGPAVVPKPG